MFHRILVPVDGSDASNAAVEVAVALAGEQKAALRFVTVVESSLGILETVGRATELPNPLAVAEAHKKVVSDAADMAKKHGASADFQVVEGSDLHVGECVAKAVADWQADLVVLGTHGRRGVNRLVLGSVTEVVMRHSDVPVLAVPISA